MLSFLPCEQDAKNVRGIFFDTSKLRKSMWLDRSTFTHMPNLRYIKIYDSCCSRQCKNQDCFKLDFPDGLQFPLEEVRYLHWVKFPLEKLPPDFRPENLVDLRLPYSNITRVWEGKKVCLCVLLHYMFSLEMVFFLKILNWSLDFDRMHHG